MMRLLANENFPGVAMDALRVRGHDVIWIRTEAPGITDQEVLKKAVAEQRTIVTFDKDFGELVFRIGVPVGVPASCGVILFRIPTTSPEYIAHTAATVLEQRTDWAGHFAVIEETRVRLIPLP